MSRETTTSLNPQQTIIPLAALFEGEFSIDWIEEILQLRPSKILKVLENGVHEQILTRKSPGTYDFSLMDTRREYEDQLYEKDKAFLHGKIARLFEKELPDTETKGFDIARHLLNTKNDCWGCQWLLKAGIGHVNAFHIDEAARCFKKATSDSVALQGEEADLVFIKATVEYSNIFLTREGIENILSHLQLAMKKADSLNHKSYQALIEMHMAKNKWLLNLDLNEALKNFRNGLSKAEKIDAPELTASVTVFKTYFLFWQGLFREVIDVYEKSMPDIERHPLGHFPTMAAVTVARSYAMIGELTQGLGMLDTIREHCLENNNLYMAARSASSIGSILLSIHRLEDAIQYLRISLQEAQKSENHWIVLISTLMLALAHYYYGEKKESLNYLRDFLRHTKHANIHPAVHANLLEICWAVEENDFPEIRDLSFENVLRPQLSIENVYIKGIAHRYQALFFKHKDHPITEIITSLEHSIRFLQRSGNRVETAKSQLELSRLHLEMGNEKKADAYKQMASEVLEPINSDLIPHELKSFNTNYSPGEIILEEMSKIGNYVFSIHDPKRILGNILISANRTIGAERGAIFLIEKEGDEVNFQLRVSKNFTQDQMRHPAFAPTLEKMRDVALSGKGCIMSVPSENRQNPKDQGPIRSRLCVPIALKGETLGLMYHDNRLISGVFNNSHIQIISFLAAFTAFILDNEHSHELIDKLKRKLINNTFIKENIHKESSYEGIIGKSKPIRNVISKIEKVSSTDAAVLILGETGVGKDLIAEAIHKRSLRNDGPFVKVQCNTLQESLIISELFGHEKGAFTGANNRRIGRFELADGGTFFLDEIGDLPLDVQVRLLNVLQTKRFERIGGAGKSIHSDFRFIAATNRDMEQLISHKQFREDLFYRINVFPIHVPPLRERKKDILLLAEHFLRIYSSRAGKKYLSIPPDDLEEMTKYNWPGNIREMQNLIERSVILANGPELRLGDLLPANKETPHAETILSLAENERRHILKALHATEWKIRGPGGAAELLDMHPSTLTSRIKKMGIKRPENMRRKK